MRTEIDHLIGSTISQITGCKTGSDKITIATDRGTLTMHHYQDCCESVTVEDVVGDPSDLIGGVASIAEVRINEKDAEYDHETWTLYEIRTTKGDITIRWYGTSNGYYSESVDLEWEPMQPCKPAETT